MTFHAIKSPTGKGYCLEYRGNNRPTWITADIHGWWKIKRHATLRAGVLNVALEREAADRLAAEKPPAPKAFMLHLSTDNGDDYSLHATEAAAQASLAGYILQDMESDQWLKPELQKLLDGADPETVGDARLCEVWGDYQSDCGDEFGNIRELPIEGAENPLREPLRRAIEALNSRPNFKTPEGVMSYALLPELDAAMKGSA